MDILLALKQEQGRLRQQLKGLEGAIVALGGSLAVSRAQIANPKGADRKGTMSSAGRAKISKLTKARWAKFRAAKAKKAK